MVKKGMVKLHNQQVLEMLPENWSQVKLDTYINKLMKVKVVTENEDPVTIMENTIKLISVFLDFEPHIIEQFPMTLIKQMNDRLSFMSESPKPLQYSRYNWIKTIEDPTYDDYITFIKCSEQIDKGDLSNFPLIIKVVLRSKLTNEEILQMPMDEVQHGFFLLRKSLLNYLKSTMKDLRVQVIAKRVNEMMDQMKVVEGMPFKKKLKIIRENFKELMVGTSLPKK